ncbi:MAG: methylamine dehydrogenase (amicyanin) small subunit [Gammaproteobacteria bacterium]|nr:methylamine dehydrogenase (amicyanin) small subunit [Gammaproteobacteria bacterium]NIR85627.1 methylamine dehydrogenase (amicyanin) small subunit [Gammaproteobacteria bacterium]NIR90115.1 methylamine dehydrogenase (amicyanin) small subunit [Gammaproteobacteria bacterium]NIU06761.1 methylamine dehydrogenase (amicyanin) small subunit [Gammaproteobacteria bacterium]NIV53694.1 methylamine dehydrogenase (amicyanin) small subunit [Gammaproteobacteria bacterium]
MIHTNRNRFEWGFKSFEWAVTRRNGGVEWIIERFDGTVEKVTRAVAQRVSRRGFVSTVTKVVVGGVVLPLLPVDRNFQLRNAHAEEFAKTAQTTDPKACNYWRYCAHDGYSCACCGGGPSVCPPGSYPSPTSWVGSCINPDDDKTYLIAYGDCCGKDSCARCECLHTEGEMPVYRPQLNNDIVWCFGARSMVYHCTSAALIGEA